MRSASPAVKAQAAAYLHARVNTGWIEQCDAVGCCWMLLECDYQRRHNSNHLSNTKRTNTSKVTTTAGATQQKRPI